MKTFSLRTIIDDILLIVRNNNISESEDLSRAQIASWIIQYKAYLNKRENDKKEEQSNDDATDDSISKQIGPLELIEELTPDGQDIHRKRTKEKLPDLLDDSADSIICVNDAAGHPIQQMNEKRRHFHYFRKYTFGEMTYYYENGYIYVEGLEDLGKLQYIYVTGTFSDLDDDDADEDDITIPGWMISDIKSMIMKNELGFMINRPSDDTNNSSMATVKPHMPNAARNQEE